MKNSIRKALVGLKRNTSMIPMAVLMVAFLWFSLNMTHLSNTTAKIQGAGMGLAQFAVMLLGMLSMVCLMNSFPRRKKPNYPMIVLMFVMFGIMIFCDMHYNNAILAAVTRPQNPIVIDSNTAYIQSAYNVLSTHIVLLVVTAVLVVTLPIYSKWIKRINTSVDVEDNGDMAAIEISE